MKIVFIIIILILLVVVVRYKYVDYSKRQRQKKRFARGNTLEKEAKVFLEKKGFSVIKEQFIQYHNFKVDGENHQAKLIVDYIVKKSGKKYLVEVKSGKSAITVKDKNTRRQLLEYDYVIKNDGTYLLDMENKKMQLIKFSSKEERNNNNLFKVLVGISLIGILFPFWSVKIIVTVLLGLTWFYPSIYCNIINLNK